MDFLFLLGISMLPFEAYAFAPSSGWATVSPLIFAAYLLMNFPLMLRSFFERKQICFFIAGGFVLSMINFLPVGMNVSSFLDAVISCGLGLVSLIAFHIYFIIKKHDTQRVESILLVSYSISLVVGWIQYLAVKLPWFGLINFFSSIHKRNYLNFGRVQFTFTEPSFIGMHLFGVLLLFYMKSKNKKLRNLLILYCLSVAFINTSVRFIMDITVVLFVLALGRLDFKKAGSILILLLVPVIAIAGITVAYENNDRFRRIMNNGVYADGSFASRYFRINASVRGYVKQPVHFLFGYGLGSAIIPIRSGYWEARSEYTHTYMREVEQLGDPLFIEDSVAYCLYIRVISEFGFLMFLAAAVYILRLMRSTSKDMRMYGMIVLYLYIQWDTLSFYTLWMFIVLAGVDLCKQPKPEALPRKSRYIKLP